MHSLASKFTKQEVRSILFQKDYFSPSWQIEFTQDGDEWKHFIIRNEDDVYIAIGTIDQLDFDVAKLEYLVKTHPNISRFYWICSETHELNVFRKAFNTEKIYPLKNSTVEQDLITQRVETLLVPLDKKFENVLFEAHSHLRDIDGLHADSALDEICKILVAKIYDEQQHSRQFNSQYQCADETSAVVRELFSKAIKEKNKERSNSAFNTPMTLSVPALIKVVKEFEYFDFANSPVDIKGRAFQNLLSPALRSGMGQYFTPMQVVEMIVKCIDPKSTEKIIDPFCGSAHFLSKSIEHIQHVESKDFDAKKFVEKSVFGIDKSERMIRIGSTDILLMDGALPNLILSDSLLDIDSYDDVEKETFDVVITNPPFGSILGQETFSTLGNFDLLSQKSSVPLEVLGLERSIQFLRDKGRLAIVLPDSILLNKKASYVRDWLSKNVKVRAVIGLPIETFAPFGASVKTSILICSKGQNSGNHNVFMTTLRNIGYDATGRAIDGNCTGSVTSEFMSFIEREGW